MIQSDVTSFKDGHFDGGRWDNGLRPAIKKQREHLSCSRSCGSRDERRESNLMEDCRGNSVLRGEPVRTKGERHIGKKEIS